MNNIKIPQKQVGAFCQRWKISEFALFGSILRDDFSSDSDVDVLITFEPDIPWSSYDWVDMIDELTKLFGRKVDLVEKSTLRNPFRRKSIMNNMRVLYDA